MKKGVQLVLLTALISGVSIFANAFGVKGFDSSVFTFAKNIVVALFLTAVLIGFYKKDELFAFTKKQWGQLALIGLIGGSIPFLLFFHGLQLTSGTTGAFIHKTLFIFASIFALVFLKEKLHKLFFVGAALLLAGTFFMLRPALNLQTGHLFVLAATIFWAVENVLAKKVLRELSGMQVAWGRMAFGSVFLLAFLVATGKTSTIVSMSGAQYAWILVTSVFLFAYVMTYYAGLKHISVSTATSVLAIGAPITLVLQVLFSGASFTLFNAVGSVLIVAGVVCVVLLQVRPEVLKRLWTAKN